MFGGTKSKCIKYVNDQQMLFQRDVYSGEHNLANFTDQHLANRSAHANLHSFE